MQQHLYHAAIDEFEAAIRQSPRVLLTPGGAERDLHSPGNAPKALEGAAKAVTR
jgi:hypothetical protein